MSGKDKRSIRSSTIQSESIWMSEFLPGASASVTEAELCAEANSAITRSGRARVEAA